MRCAYNQPTQQPTTQHKKMLHRELAQQPHIQIYARLVGITRSDYLRKHFSAVHSRMRASSVQNITYGKIICSVAVPTDEGGDKPVCNQSKLCWPSIGAHLPTKNVGGAAAAVKS